MGPMSPTQFPPELVARFLADFGESGWRYPHEWLESTRQQVREQVPELAWPHMHHDGQRWEPRWSRACVDALVDAATQRNPRVGPHTNYLHAAEQLFIAFERVCLQDRSVAVLGSVSPWIEAICIAFGAREVATVDYVPVTVESPHIVAYAVGAAALRQKRFDVVVSYSSLEHDGLGRYGDPIDPDGDVAAVEEAFDMLRPGGTFVCGLPVGAGCIEGNFHRIYNRKRLDRLFRIFGATASALEANKNVVPWPPSADACDYSGARWQNQPVFILQRPLCVLPL
jgi:SAM-dependent methyltransferase